MNHALSSEALLSPGIGVWAFLLMRYMRPEATGLGRFDQDRLSLPPSGASTGLELSYASAPFAGLCARIAACILLSWAA